MPGIAAAAAVELPPSPPAWVVLMRRGPLRARDGRRWRLDDLEAVIAATRARAGSTDLVVDYEHQSDRSQENGQPAPAAGWMPELRARGGALEARVEWTDRARAMLEAREYRYLSPWFLHRPDGRVAAVVGAGLTNTPALDLPALAREEEADMDERFKRLLAALGLAEDADEAAVAAALARVEGGRAAADALRGLAEPLGLAADAAPGDVAAAARTAAASAQTSAQAFGRVREALGLAEDADADAVAAAARARGAGADPGQHVPRSEFDRVAGELAAMRTEQDEAQASAAVDEAVAAGRVPPALRDWALSYARADLDGFKAYAKAAPAVAAPAGPGRPPAQDPAAPLDAQELAVCRALGVDAESFRAARARDLERGEGEAA